MGHQNLYLHFVYISHSDQQKLLEMYFIKHTDSVLIHSNLCTHKSLKHTYPGSDPVTSLYFFFTPFKVIAFETRD